MIQFVYILLQFLAYIACGKKEPQEVKDLRDKAKTLPTELKKISKEIDSTDKENALLQKYNGKLEEFEKNVKPFVCQVFKSAIEELPQQIKSLLKEIDESLITNLVDKNISFAVVEDYPDTSAFHNLAYEDDIKMQAASPKELEGYTKFLSLAINGIIKKGSLLLLVEPKSSAAPPKIKLYTVLKDIKLNSSGTGIDHTAFCDAFGRCTDQNSIFYDQIRNTADPDKFESIPNIFLINGEGESSSKNSFDLKLL